MTVIRRVTEVPGPNARAWLARRAAVVARGVGAATPVVAAYADGARVTDVDGNVYLDFAGGLGALNLGHRPADVVAAAVAQLGQLPHTAFQVSTYESYVTLAERLTAVTPGAFPKRVLLLNSGAEAVENAIKIARHATGRPGVICFDDAFHGRTLFALGLTSRMTPYKQGFGPFDGTIHRVPYAYCYRCPVSANYPDCAFACLDAIEHAFRHGVDPASIAAVIVEPVLGEGGFVVPPRGYLTALAGVCRRYGILLIADEVQTGLGRTGRLFACDHDGVEPDLLITAKSLAGGLPLAAVVGRADVMDHPDVGSLGSTFGGNPVACAAGIAVLDRLASGELLRRAEAIGARIEAEARTWEVSCPLVGDIRRLGAMVGVELVHDRASREPAPDAAAALVREAGQRGVMLLSAGTASNVVRFLVPLSVSDEELDEGLAVLTACVDELR